MGGHQLHSKNTMTEFFHDISWQVLSSSYAKVKIESSSIAVLVKNIKYLIEKKLIKLNSKIK